MTTTSAPTIHFSCSDVYEFFFFSFFLWGGGFSFFFFFLDLCFLHQHSLAAYTMAKDSNGKPSGGLGQGLDRMGTKRVSQGRNMLSSSVLLVKVCCIFMLVFYYH